jgi:hypothetical protein
LGFLDQILEIIMKKSLIAILASIVLGAASGAFAGEQIHLAAALGAEGASGGTGTGAASTGTVAASTTAAAGTTAAATATVATANAVALGTIAAAGVAAASEAGQAQSVTSHH